MDNVAAVLHKIASESASSFNVNLCRFVDVIFTMAQREQIKVCDNK